MYPTENQVNFFESFSKPHVLQSITLRDWIELIKSSEFSNQIAELRTKNLTKAEWRIEKANFPCITPNFLYKNYKNDSKIIGSTGYIYIDIDTPDFNIEPIKDKVAAYNKSISGKGYGIYLRVTGLTPDNFKANYRTICNELGISVSVDDKAIKASQFNVLSFDPEAWYTDDSYTYSASTVPPSTVPPSSVIGDSNNIDINCTPFAGNNRTTNTYTDEGGTPIRFNNIDEIEIPEGSRYIVKWEGIKIIMCWIPAYKIHDGRKRFLLSYTNNFVFLNPKLGFGKVLEILKNVNQVAFTVPLPHDIIQSILKSIMVYKQKNTLQPIYSIRYIIFRQKEKFMKGEKIDIALTEISIHKTENSIAKIKDIIDSWDYSNGIISIRNIAKFNKISKKTVAKYYKIFKVQIEEKNNLITNKKPEQMKEELKPVPEPMLAKSSQPIEPAKEILPVKETTVKSLKKGIKELIDASVENRIDEYSIKKEIQLSVNNIVQLDKSIDKFNLYKSIVSYYQNKLKTA